MTKYKLVNNTMGWVVFAIAAITYCLTIEPTASFWDCPEFITTADKLEVGHPPGAPFFMLFGKFFTLFASDASQVAMMINIMNALLSAACILFLFWSVTHLAKKLICSDVNSMTTTQLIAIMASGVGGALIYTWSDTFWFSAVEGEVYAFSSFFTALVFWLILKWEDEPDGPRADRWLILISYLVGLSIGVHLLNLLCIPAIVLIYYFKRNKSPRIGGALLVLGVSVVLIAAVLYGMVPGITKVGGVFEIIFVNWFGMPFNTGVVVYILVLVSCLAWGLYETHRSQVKVSAIMSFLLCVALMGIPFIGHGGMSWVIGILVILGLAFVLFWGYFITTDKPQPFRSQKTPNTTSTKSHVFTPRLLNTTLLCLTLMTVGYSSYALIVIRSSANPPMDQNSPRDIFTLAEYLGREQYGDRPLLYGPTYASYGEYNDKDSLTKYVKEVKRTGNEPDKYKLMRKSSSSDYVYPSDQCMFFPRIYSRDHKDGYEAWLGGNVSKNKVNYNGHKLEIPTAGSNLKFFVSYQVNHMYNRYFMWNFAGRQNDIQNADGNSEHGNWLTGFSFWDNARLGDQSLLPSDLKNNKGNNVFYCLPLILGLLGLFWQAFKGEKGIQQFWVVFFLFFMTGIAIVLYLNQTPNQPRERDYAYAGSFYAFAIWCGLGVTAVYDLLKKGFKFLGKKAELAAVAIACVPALVVPLQMVSQTWDDHDRSDRYMCRDFGLNYLETIPENGVIFTNGDNDTFPLWYNEDTEGNRTDVRVCNLSYLATDWYINQMKRPAFDSDPLPISWKHYQYQEGANDFVRINPTLGYYVEYYNGTSQFLSNDEAASLSNDMKEQISAAEPVYFDDYIHMAFDAKMGNPSLAKEIFGKQPYNDVPTVVVKEDGSSLTDTIHDCYDYHQCVKMFLLKDYPEKYKDVVLVEGFPELSKLPACLPSERLYFKVNKDAVKKSGMKTYGIIPEYMVMDLKDRLADGTREGYMYKNFMMMIEIIAQMNFSRPVFMSTTVGPDNFGNLCKHFVLEGMAWRITPYTFEKNVYEPRNADVVMCDVDKMYANMMNKYRYGNLKQEGLYIDETVQRMCYTHRRWFSELVKNLLKDADKLKAKADTCEDAIEKKTLVERAKTLKAKALKALEKCDKEIPEYNVNHNFGTGSLDLAKAYLTLNQLEKGKHILDALWQKSEEYFKWYASFSGTKDFNYYSRDLQTQVAMMGYVVKAYCESIVHGVEKKEDLAKLETYLNQRVNDFKKYYNQVQSICQRNMTNTRIEDITESVELGNAYLYLNKVDKGCEILDRCWREGAENYDYMMDPHMDVETFQKNASVFVLYLDIMEDVVKAYYDAIENLDLGEQELEKLTSLYTSRSVELNKMKQGFDNKCMSLGLY